MASIFGAPAAGSAAAPPAAAGSSSLFGASSSAGASAGASSSLFGGGGAAPAAAPAVAPAAQQSAPAGGSLFGASSSSAAASGAGGGVFGVSGSGGASSSGSSGGEKNVYISDVLQNLHTRVGNYVNGGCLAAGGAGSPQVVEELLDDLRQWKHCFLAPFRKVRVLDSALTQQQLGQYILRTKENEQLQASCQRCSQKYLECTS
eukprot:gene466-187_t